MTRCQTDPCCYVINTTTHITIVVIHVDDCIIFGSNAAEVKKVKDALKKEYKISDLGPIEYALGWRIKRDRKNRTLTIDKRHYILEIVEKFGLKNADHSAVPANPLINYSRLQCPSTEDEKLKMADVPYLEALGLVLYVATSTRPDISYAVSELAKFASNPGKPHWEGLKQVIRYLNGTSEYGICYGTNANSSIEPLGYVDASNARCPDTRRSRYGGCFKVNGGLVQWQSKNGKRVHWGM